MWSYYHTIMQHVHGWNTHEWLVVFAVAVGVGAFALRGFGSRSTY
jgi:hypothetical protein